MITEQFIIYKDNGYLVTAECYYEYINDSFDHEFGTHFCGYYELVGFDLIDCRDKLNNVVIPDSEFFGVILEAFSELEY